MDYSKYIIVDYGVFEQAIMFSNVIAHADFLKMFPKDQIVSAGFFDVGTDKSGNITVSVFGKSTTLQLGTRENDNILLKKALRKSII
jgi:hypothetical protein